MRLNKRWTYALLVIVLTGCTATGTPSGSSLPSSPQPTVSGIQSNAPSVVPATSDDSSSPEASSSETVSLAQWTGAELFLLSGVADEIRPACARATDLPADAAAGIQCHPDGIAAIGYYLFTDRDTMREWYFARLSEFGVEPQSGEVCRDGLPGEGTDTPGNPGFEYRIGCYVDTTGSANVRMALPAVTYDLSVYVGAAGQNDSIPDLISWLFPNHDPAAIGCNFCIGQIWSAGRLD